MVALRIGKHRYLEIPASVDVKKIKVDRKLIKQYGKVWQIPLTLDDAKLVYHKSSEKAVIKHKKGYKTVFIDGSELGYDGVIFVIGLPKKSSLTIKNKRIQLFVPKHHSKITVLALGDAIRPVAIDDVIEFNYIEH